MITTIQLTKDVKCELDKIKLVNQSYEQVILKLLDISQKYEREREQLLIEGCVEMSKENLKMTRHFESIEDLSNWEW
jgi:predicted CopG family antitoxin